MAVCSVSLLRNLSLYSSVANLTISLQPSLNSVWRKQKASHLSLKKGEIYFFNSISAKSKIIQLFEKKIDCCALRKIAFHMDRKPFSTTTPSTVTATAATNSQNKTVTSNQPLTVEELDIEILPTIYEIIRW